MSRVTHTKSSYDLMRWKDSRGRILVGRSGRRSKRFYCQTYDLHHFCLVLKAIVVSMLLHRKTLLWIIMTIFLPSFLFEGISCLLSKEKRTHISWTIGSIFPTHFLIIVTSVFERYHPCQNPELTFGGIP